MSETDIYRSNSTAYNDLPLKSSRRQLFIRTSLICGVGLGLYFWLSASLAQTNSLTFRRGPQKNAARTLTYTVRGEVRFLLFWAGRDNVGGGQLSLAGGSGGTRGQEWEQVDIRFGSNPERVPGRVNLWGYANERAYWRVSTAGQRDLMRTAFEGFIHPRNTSPARSYRYKSIRGDITETKATSEIGFFAENADLDYRSAEQVIRRYDERLRSIAAETKSELSRNKSKYDAPYGFLTALKDLVSRITEEATGNPEGWVKSRPSRRYVHQAKPYRLAVRKIRSSEFTLAAAGGGEGSVQKAAEVEFRIENLNERTHHDFTLWFVVRGPMQGLPLRIVYQPRWWLRLSVVLESDFFPDSAAGEQ